MGAGAVVIRDVPDHAAVAGVLPRYKENLVPAAVMPAAVTAGFLNVRLTVGTLGRL